MKNFSFKEIVKILKSLNILIMNDSINPQARRILKRNPEVKNLVFKATNFISDESYGSLRERIYCIKNSVTEIPTCKICGKELKFRINGRYSNSYPIFCSSPCVSRSEEVKRKRNDTVRKIYGFDNVSKNEHIKEKIKQVKKEKYGDENYSNQEKAKQTKKERYGDENYNNFERGKKTKKEKYGDENYNNLEKGKQTNKEKYGVENVFESDFFQKKAKDTMVHTYGKPHALQVDSLKKKFENTMERKYGRPHFHSSNISPESFEKLYNEEWIRDKYLNQHLATQEIADRLGVVNSTILKQLHYFNIKVRHYSSQSEEQIKDFISNNFSKEIIFNDKRILKPKELDIYIPEINLAIEYNGIFWHSEINGKKDKNYHLNKTLACQEKDIHLVQVWSSEWATKRKIVKSRINSLLNMNKRIYARQCIINKLSSKEAMVFLDNTHIQAFRGGNVHLGLIYKNELVGVMTFGKSRFNVNYPIELIRYSTALNTTIVGGANKLFKYYIKHFNPTRIISYSDKRWNKGNLYKILNFEYSHSSNPNYWYFNTSNVNLIYSRIQFQKHKLKDKLNFFDENVSEWENMKQNGYDRIWDCGNDVFVWNR